MATLKQQIEYIIGSRCNDYYNDNIVDQWYDDDDKPVKEYYKMAKINWRRELKKKACVICMKYSQLYHPDITWDIIRDNINLNWSWCNILKRQTITWDIIKMVPDHLQNWVGISQNPNIIWNIIRANPTKPWHWVCVSRHPNITWDIIQDNPGYPWNWYGISKNRNITWDIIQANPDKPWKWRNLSVNPNITWDIIQANPNLDWCLDSIIKNPNITWDIIQTIPENIRNTFDTPELLAIEYDNNIGCFTAKYQATASRITNYLARYIRYEIVTISLEYGY